MRDSNLSRKIEALQQRMYELQLRAAGDSVQLEEVLPEAFVELQSTLEELYVAEEKLRHQNEELVAARQVVEAGRKRAEEALLWEAEVLLWEVGVNAAIANLSEALILSASIGDISSLTLEHAKRLTGSAFGYVGYIDPQTGYLVCPAITRDIWDTCQVPDKDIVFETFGGLWGWVLENRKPLLTNTPPDDPILSGVPPSHIPIDRFLSVPALIGETLVGQVALANSDRDYTERDLALVKRLASLYSLAVQRRRAEEELKKYRDHLETLVAERTTELTKSNEQLRREITERKRAEEALQKERDRAQKYLDVAGVMFVAIDADYKVTLINKRGCKVLGYKEEEIIGENWLDIVPERIKKEIESVFQKLMAGEIKPVEYRENPVLTKSGEERIIAWHNTVLTNEAGNIVGILSSGGDISERKALEEMWRRYEFIVNTSGEFMTLIDNNYTYQAANESYCKAHSKTQEEIIGSTVADIWGKERFKTIIKAYLDKCFAGNEVYYQDWFEFAALGQRCFDVAYYPFYGDDGGIVTHVVVVSRDVTQRKQAERDLMVLYSIAEVMNRSLDLDSVLQRALDSALEIANMDSGGILLLDPSTNELSLRAHRGCSQKLIQVVSHAKVKVNEGLMPRMLRSALVIDDLSEMTKDRSTAFEKEGLQFLVSVPLKVRESCLGVMVTASRNPRTLTSRELSLLAGIGNQVGVAVDRAKLQAQKLRAAVLEERQIMAQKMHDDIAQTLSFLGLQVDSVMDSPSLGQNLGVQTELEGIRRVIEDTYKRVRSSIIRLEEDVPGHFDLGVALPEIVSEFEKQTECRVESRVDRGQLLSLPPSVAFQATYIIREALSNVTKHSGADSVHLTLQGLEDGMVEVTIQDNGCGFDLDSGQQSSRGGFGLRFMRERAKRAGGSLRIESGPGQGTRVVVSLPSG